MGNSSHAEPLNPSASPDAAAVNSTTAPVSSNATPPATGNSSDFVKKLYKMLEDPAHSSIVRWGDANDSFVVLECEKFTKYILPKHFKHSNFASFVRQLNKYDFHKVRQSPDDNQSPYGTNAWEFKHPEFKANNKDSLENIRRKAPAARKPSNMGTDGVSHRQFENLNRQVVLQSQQLRSMTDRYTQIAMDNQVLAEELRRMQRTALAHDAVLQNMMSYLQGLHTQRKRRKTGNGNEDVNSTPAPVAFPTENTATPNGSRTTSAVAVGPDEDAIHDTPLVHAQKILSAVPNTNSNNMQGAGQVNIAPVAGIQNTSDIPLPKVTLPSSTKPHEQQPSETVSSSPSQPQQHLEHAGLQGRSREPRPSPNPQSLPYPPHTQSPRQPPPAARMNNGDMGVIYSQHPQVLDNVGSVAAPLYPNDSMNGLFPLPSQAAPPAMGPSGPQASLLQSSFASSRGMEPVMHPNARVTSNPGTANATPGTSLLNGNGHVSANGPVNGVPHGTPNGVAGNMAYGAYGIPDNLRVSPAVHGPALAGMGNSVPVNAAIHASASIPSSTPAADVNGQLPEKRRTINSNPGWVKTPRILLVEDDVTCRHVGYKFLQGFQCQVDVAVDGIEAVDRIQQQGQKYDLILMDIIMPVLDGVATCTILRRTEMTPVIAMTSNIRQSDIDMYYSSGMNDVLPKPFARETLLSMLKKYLAHSAENGQVEPQAPVRGAE